MQNVQQWIKDNTMKNTTLDVICQHLIWSRNESIYPIRLFHKELNICILQPQINQSWQSGTSRSDNHSNHLICVYCRSALNWINQSDQCRSQHATNRSQSVCRTHCGCRSATRTVYQSDTHSVRIRSSLYHSQSALKSHSVSQYVLSESVSLSSDSTIARRIEVLNST